MPLALHDLIGDTVVFEVATESFVAEARSQLNTMNTIYDDVYNRRNDEMVMGRQGQVTSTDEIAFGQKMAAKDAQRAADNAHKNLLTATEDKRTKMLADADKAEKTAATINSLYANPISICRQAGLGESVRTNYGAQLQHMGPAALRDIMAVAMDRKDIKLAAEILNRMDGYKAQEQRDNFGMDATSFAQKFCGDSHRDFLEYRDRLLVAAKQLRLAEESLRKGRATSARDKISLGLMQHRTQRANDPTEAPTNPTPNQKIGHGLRNHGARPAKLEVPDPAAK
jgi:hypothetical protein